MVEQDHRVVVRGAWLATFTAASAACGLAPWLGFLIRARVSMLIAAALLIAATTAALTVPRRQPRQP